MKRTNKQNQPEPIAASQRRWMRRQSDQRPRLHPSAELRLDNYGSYERAVAWAAVHDRHKDSEQTLKYFGDITLTRNYVERETSTFLIADLYGVEIGQATHDIIAAREREDRIS